MSIQISSSKLSLSDKDPLSHSNHNLDFVQNTSLLKKLVDQASFPKKQILSNAAKLKDKLEELQKLTTHKGRKEYIEMKLEERKVESKTSTLMKIKPFNKSKIYDQKKILELLNKKTKLLKPNNNNETKFDAYIKAFRKVGTFIDLRQLIKKMNIVEDDDFKEFLDNNKLAKEGSFSELSEIMANGKKFTSLEAVEQDELDDKLKHITHPQHVKLLKKIHNRLNDINEQKNMNSDLSRQLMGTLEKEEESFLPNEEFYQKINDYLHNEQLMFSNIEQIIAENNQNQLMFSEHKRNRQASQLFENYQAFKEIKEINNLLKDLGINMNDREKELLEAKYSMNYTQHVCNFRKTLKLASIDVLKKNVEEYTQSKQNVFRRNAVLTGSPKLAKMAIIKNMNVQQQSMENREVFEEKRKKIMQNLSVNTENVKNIIKKESELRTASKLAKSFKSPSMLRSIKNIKTNSNTSPKISKSIGTYEVLNSPEINKNLQIQEILSTEACAMEETPLKIFSESNYFNLRKNQKFELPKRNFNKTMGFSQESMNIDNKNLNIHNKYNGYLNFINENLKDAKFVKQNNTKSNLSKTFEWFVQDIEKIEKNNQDEKRILGDKFKSYTDKVNEIWKKHEVESLKTMNIFKIEKEYEPINVKIERKALRKKLI